MAKHSARVTAAEVARHSGVSQATVSYVLNDTPTQKISDATRQRVLRSVAELGYTPYEPARALRSGQSSVVLFIAPDYPVGHVISEMSDRLIELLTGQGRTLLTHRDTAGVSLIDVARSLSPYAVISMIAIDPAVRRTLEDMGARVEILGFREPTGAEDADVAYPQERVGWLQAEHLHARGRTRLAYALPDDPRAEMFYAPRLAAVQEYCVTHDLAAPLLGTIPYDLQRATDVVRSWREASVTGVCAYTDDIAIGVIGGARGIGLDVPRDLAVIGVDDIPLSRMIVPPLTTVHLDVDAMARETVRPLGVAIDGEPADLSKSAWIVERSST